MSTDQGGASRRFSGLGLAICFALALAACAVYFPVSRFDFIQIDDPKYIVDNHFLRDGFTGRGLNWAFTSFYPDNWFPLTRLSHMLDYALFGLDGPRHHDVNILIHALAAVMLYLFLARATRQRWPSAFIAAIFALHPLHVESVAWISERKDVLCAFFWFAALWAWVRYAEHPSIRRYSVALLFFACGLMSKPMIVTLPILLLAIDFWPLRRTFSQRLITEKLPFLALSIADGILTVLAQHAAGALHSLDAVPPFMPRLENALTTVVIYLRDTVWPAGLSNPYPWPVRESVGPAVAAGLAITLVSVIVLRLRRRFPYLATGWFWFLLTLLPVIGLIQAGPQARADRYMYVPMTGVLIMLAWGVGDLLRLVPRPLHPLAAIAAVTACAALARVTWIQQQYWQDSQVLFHHAVAEDEQNYLAWAYLGTSMDKDQQLPQMIECYRMASQLRPDISDLRTQLTVALLRAGRIPEAIEEFQTALRLRPRDPETRCLFGRLLIRLDRLPEAISQFSQAIAAHPEYPEAYNDLGAAYWRVPDKMDEAKAQFEKALALRPAYAHAHSNLGLVLLATPGGQAEAVRHFIQALALDPRDISANLGLSKALLQPPFSDPAAARAHLDAASRLEPDAERLRKYEMPQVD